MVENHRVEGQGFKNAFYTVSLHRYVKETVFAHTAYG